MSKAIFAKDSLAGQVAVITGGGTGIGEAIAHALADCSAAVAIVSRNLDRLEATAERIRKAGGTALAVELDIRDPQRVEAVMAQVETELGGLDILVNNAAANFACPAEKLSPNGWRTIVDIGLNGTFFCSQAAGRIMARRGGGSIVNILSTNVYSGARGRSHAAAAKAGVLSLTKTLAVEWAERHIRVNAVAPGPTDTQGSREQVWTDPEQLNRLIERMPFRRFVRPEEVASAVLFLASGASGYISGEMLVVDGATWLSGASYV